MILKSPKMIHFVPAGGLRSLKCCRNAAFSYLLEGPYTVDREKDFVKCCCS